MEYKLSYQVTAYLIAALLKKCDTMEAFNKYYDHVANILYENKITYLPTLEG